MTGDHLWPIDRIKTVFSTLLSDGLFRDGSILVFAAVIAGGVNYLYQIVMGRLLGPVDYGVFGSLFALSYLLLIISAGIGYCSTKFVSDTSGAERVGFVRGLGLRVALLTATLFAALVIAAPYLAAFLHIGDPTLVVIMGLTLLFGPLYAVNRGTMRGLEDFIAMGSLGIGNAVLKFAAGIILVLLGYGVYGAIGGPAVAAVLTVAAAGYYLRRLYLGSGSFDRYSSVYRYAVPSLLVAFCFTVPTNADVVLVKHLFSAHQAGLYTSVSVFGKLLIFLPGGISSALFPKVAKRESNGELGSDLLRRSLLYVGGLVGIVSVVLMLFPELFIGVLYGQSYVEAAAVLRWYIPAIAAFSMCVVMLNYSLAANDLRFVKAFTVMTVAEIGLLYLFGSSVFQMVAVLFVINTAGALLGWFILREGSWSARVSGADPHQGVVGDD